MNYFKTLLELFRIKSQVGMSVQRMRALQEMRLRRLLHYAWTYSAYYRRTFEAAGIDEASLDELPLSCFPTIDKTVLLENFEEIITAADVTQQKLREFDEEKSADRRPYKGKYHVVRSSGSTGKPGYFVYDETAWHTMLLGMIRAALWDMSMPRILALLARKPRIVYIAATDGRYGGAMAVGDGIDGVGASQLYLDIKTPLKTLVQQLHDFEPNIIIGYPSAIKLVAELVERGAVAVDVTRVISCGEPLGASLRNYLEKVFKTTVVNFYGASESLALGVEMDPAQGMLLFDDMNIIEIENGEMYLTCLYNYCQPLIRYRISDTMVLSAAGDNSPYPLTRAVGLIGRNEDLLWFKDRYGNEEFLHPLAIEGFCMEGLKDYQFCQTGPDAFEMIAEASPAASEKVIRSEMLREMRKILAEKHLDYVRFSVNFVDEIRPDPKTGKKTLIIKKGTVWTDEGYNIAG